MNVGRCKCGKLVSLAGTLHDEHGPIFRELTELWAGTVVREVDRCTNCRPPPLAQLLDASTRRLLELLAEKLEPNPVLRIDGEVLAFPAITVRAGEVGESSYVWPGLENPRAYMHLLRWSLPASPPGLRWRGWHVNGHAYPSTTSYAALHASIDGARAVSLARPVDALAAGTLFVGSTVALVYDNPTAADVHYSGAIAVVQYEHPKD